MKMTIFYSENVKTKEITVKLSKIIKHTFRSTTYSKAIDDFVSPCNFNNFDSFENDEV